MKKFYQNEQKLMSTIPVIKTVIDSNGPYTNRLIKRLNDEDSISAHHQFFKKTNTKFETKNKKNSDHIEPITDKSKYLQPAKYFQNMFYREKIHQNAQELLPKPNTIKPLLNPLAIIQRPQDIFRKKVAVEAKLKNVQKNPAVNDVLYGM